MAEQLVVAITLGTRDLQVLCVREGKLCLVPPGNVGDVHRALLDDAFRYRLWMPGSGTPRLDEWRGFDLEWSHAGFELRTSRKGPPISPATAADIGEPAGEKPELILVPALLSKAFHELQADLNKGVVLARVLLIHTERARTSKWARNEPVAAAPLLCHWLPKWCPLISASHIRIVSCLVENEDLKVRTEEDEVFLLPRAALRIEEAIRKEAKSDCTMRLHDSGGIPEISEVVRATARLHFKDVDYRTPQESELAHVPLVSGLHRTSVETIDARRRARDLIRQGQFQAAAVLSEGFDDVWASCIRAAACYFQGYMTDAANQAEALSSCNMRDPLLRLVKDTWQEAFHVALRAEAALRANDVLSAASLTVTFYDVVLYDAVAFCLRKESHESCIDWKDRSILKDQFLPNLGNVHNAAAEVVRTEKRARNLSQQMVEDWFGEPTIYCSKPWQEWILFRLIEQVGQRSQLARFLQELSSKLHTRTSSGNSPANFRNMIIHSRPLQTEIEQMIRQYEDRLLWRRTEEDRLSFLHPQTRAATVLGELDLGDALNIYNELVASLVKDIETCPT